MHGTKKLWDEILLAYVGGAHLNPKHDYEVINDLKSIGYLTGGLDVETEKATLKTTELGMEYLKIHGINVYSTKYNSKIRKFVSKLFYYNFYNWWFSWNS